MTGGGESSVLVHLIPSPHTIWVTTSPLKWKGSLKSEQKNGVVLIIRNYNGNTFLDMLVRYPCMREDDLCDLLKFDKKILRAKLATLKSDRFVQVKLKIETGESNCLVICNVALSFKHKYMCR